MRYVRFYVNGGKPGAEEMRRKLSALLGRFGLRESTDANADAVIALGGDGTILRAIHEVGELPVLGLNLGGLGYLSSISASEAEEALRMLADGRYTVSRRRLLGVRRRGDAHPPYLALNDVVVMREFTGHAARLDLEADGRLVTRYLADGLIFATPTGSTAYSLAAGGPVLMPDSASVVVTPMNPHALGVRPLVVRDDVCFTVTARARADGNAVRLGVSADGETVLELGAEDAVEIACAGQVASLVELEGRDPYETLARKLGWSGSNVK